MRTATTVHLLDSFVAEGSREVRQQLERDQVSRFIFFFYSFLFELEVEGRISSLGSFHNVLSILPHRFSLHFNSEEKL